MYADPPSVTWPWSDPWCGAASTEGGALAQSEYAMRMFNEAMQKPADLYDPTLNGD